MRPRLENHLADHPWVSVRRLDRDRPRPRPPVVHDHETVALYRSGRLTFWMQGQYEVTGGDLLLVPAGVPHFVVETQEAEASAISLCLSCLPPILRDPLAASFDDIRRGAGAVRHVADEDAATVREVFVAVARELDADGGRELVLFGHLALLTAALRRADAAAPRLGVSPHPLVADALAYIHHHAREGISLREVARHVARSPSHVAAVVKETTGDTVVGWINRTRLAASRSLLASTDLTVDLVAERCGFRSPSHFHRAFKAVHGVAPGAWRRSHRAST
ncbi:MAG: AraC family transcriptional regulator [Myxococcota bacterium]